MSETHDNRRTGALYGGKHIAKCDMPSGFGFHCFPGLNIEEIHAGSRSGTLTGNLGSGTIGVCAGVSSGTRTRRLSGTPISAIDYLPY